MNISAIISWLYGLICLHIYIFESSTPPATLAFRLVNIRDTLRLRRSQKQSCGWFQVETVVAPGISNWYSGALVRFFRVAHRP